MCTVSRCCVRKYYSQSRVSSLVMVHRFTFGKPPVGRFPQNQGKATHAGLPPSGQFASQIPTRFSWVLPSKCSSSFPPRHSFLLTPRASAFAQIHAIMPLDRLQKLAPDEPVSIGLCGADHDISVHASRCGAPPVESRRSSCLPTPNITAPPGPSTRRKKSDAEI